MLFTCRSPDDTQTNEYILLKADVKVVKDSKKQFVFQLACIGVPEVYFAADDDDEFLEWIHRLQIASKKSELNHMTSIQYAAYIVCLNLVNLLLPMQVLTTVCLWRRATALAL